jgi:predicted metal-binding membrane protein
MLCLSPRAQNDHGTPDIPSGVSVVAADRVFLAACVLLFLASASTTVLICRAMAEMGEVPMAGGWSMSTGWTPLCGGSWTAAAAVFLGMWAVMMTAMMLPSLTPVLWLLRESAAKADHARPNMFAALAGLAYLLVWAALGLAVFAGGALLLEAALRWPFVARAVPCAAGLVVIAAGLFQSSRWKLAMLAHCSHVDGQGVGTAAALGQGLRLGLVCCASCAGLTALLLVGGVMDLRSMTVIALAITAERLASAGDRVARATGGLMLGAGVIQLARAFWLV